MRKKVLSLILILIQITGFTQESKPLGETIHYPDGKKIEGAKSIAKVNQIVGVKYSYIHFDCETSDAVGYKMLTNKPIWIITDNPKSIPFLLMSFDHKKYLSSWRFEFDLNYMIKEKGLTDLYLTEAIGTPDNKKRISDGNNRIEIWTYNQLQYKFTIENGLIKKYIKS